MKKLTVLLSIILFAISMQAQLPLNWVGDSDIEPFQEATNVHEGSFSCGIIVNSGTQASCDFESAEEIPVNGGDSFKMSFWGIASEFVRARAKIVWSDGNTTYATTYLGPNTGGWEEFSFEGEVPADATGATVGIRYYDVSGFTPGEIQYLDAVTFESPTGNPLMVENGDFEDWPGLDPEPDNYPTDFTAETLGLSVSLSWTDAVGSQLPAGYLIKASTDNNITLPEDGTFVPDDLDLSDGTGAANVAFGEEGFSFTNLEGATTYYFKIFPYSNSGANVDYKTDGTPPSAEGQTSDVVIIEEQNFDESFGEWSLVSVLGDEVWTNDNNYGLEGTPCAQITGYVSGTIYPNEDWLISPAMDFSSYENEVFSFWSAVGYITANEVFGVRISTDYDGGPDPNTSTWTDLEPVLPDGGTNWEWTYSEDMDVSSFDGDNVYVAFIYYCDDQDASTWEVENVMITGEGEYTPNPEPTNYPTDFSAMAQGQDIDLSWTDATGAQLPAGYVVIGSDDGSFEVPVDGTPVANDPDFSDGYGVLNVALGTQACSFNDLMGNTTYYFTIYPYTNSGAYIDYKTDGTAPEAEATTVEVSSLLFTDFNDDWGGWTTISLVGDQQWSRDNTYGLEDTPCALMSGYQSGNFENEDWLISPPLDFSETSNEVLKFFSAKNYTGPQLELRVSTDYDGAGNPNDFTWTNLTNEVNWSGGAFAWTESGTISLSPFTSHTSVYIGYQFFSTDEASANWEIDNVEVIMEEAPPEPTNYPANFSAEGYSNDITLSWTDATGEVLPEKYLLLASDDDDIELPEDGVPVTDDPDLSDGSAALNISYGVEEHTFSYLEMGTWYYFRIFPYTNSGSLIDYKTDGTPPSTSQKTWDSYPLEDILYTTFDEDWENWEQISIAGDQVWDRDNTFGIDDTPCARISGFSGQSNENEDWLISPQVDVGGSWFGDQLIFNSAVGFSGPDLQVKISANYNGNGDPYSADWTDVTEYANMPDGDPFWEWTNSGILYLEEIITFYMDYLHVAFVYVSTVDESATWEVDNIQVRAAWVTGIEEINTPFIDLYPNPGTGMFNFEVKTPVQQIGIYTMTGSLLKLAEPDGTAFQMDLSHLNKGIYFARIVDSDANIITQKIVIK